MPKIKLVDEKRSKEVDEIPEHKPVEVGETAGGKKVQMKVDQWGLWYIEFATGGELPESLKGHRFTSGYEAEQAIRSYLQGK